MTNELYNLIYDEIIKSYSNVYRTRAISNAPFPYIVIKNVTLVDTYPTHDYSITIVAYDDANKAVSNLENIADTLQNLFNNNTYESENQNYHFTLSMRQNIDSEYLVATNAIELQMLVRVYRKGE